MKFGIYLATDHDLKDVFNCKVIYAIFTRSYYRKESAAAEGSTTMGRSM